MVARNYYVILGVSSDETDRGVRAAFRNLVKRYHPDHVGPEGAGPLREVAEAYEVLGDPSRRREYDASLRSAPARPLSDRFVRDVSMRRDLVDARPSREALFRRFEDNFAPQGVTKGHRVDELNVDVAVSPEEAGKGARLRLGVPVFGRCSRCAGRGCIGCEGTGMIESERAVAFDMPPISGRGTTFVVPLTGLGVRNFYLRVRVRVDRTAEPQSTEAK
ncbi:MAG: DnaJ domain-containing protein [Polyangiaceae bacterium]